MDHTQKVPLDRPGQQDLALEGRLAADLQRPAGLAVAFSGGVDSSYLLSVAAEARGADRVRAFLGVSASLSQHQHAQARSVAGRLAVVLEELVTGEVELPEYRANGGDRCYFCKNTLFSTIQAKLAGEVLVDGTNRDDLAAHRPGQQAARQLGVRSPLREVGLGKAAIRRLSRRRELETWDQPAQPCLSSRFPAGEPVSCHDLRRVEAAEELLRQAGFQEFRVRHHGQLARIEVPRCELALLAGTELGERVVLGLEALGYRFVTLDLAGFRSGSSSTLTD